MNLRASLHGLVPASDNSRVLHRVQTRREYLPSRLSAQYVGTRLRVQRRRDAKLFSGWIRTIETKRVVLQLNEAATWAEGERATLIANDACREALCPAVCVQPLPPEFEFLIEGDIRYSAAKEAKRVLVGSRTGVLALPGETHRVTILDASETGVGIELDKRLERGTMASLAVERAFGDIRLVVEVRYCRSLPDTNRFRAGLWIRFADRLSGEHWQKLVAH